MLMFTPVERRVIAAAVLNGREYDPVRCLDDAAGVVMMMMMMMIMMMMTMMMMMMMMMTNLRGMRRLSNAMAPTWSRIWSIGSTPARSSSPGHVSDGGGGGKGGG